MFSNFVQNLRKALEPYKVLDDGASGLKPTTTTKSGNKFVPADGEYGYDNTSVALFSYNDENGDRRYGHLFIPHESLHEHDYNNNSALKVIGAELDDGRYLDYNQTMDLLHKVDTGGARKGLKADKSREQFMIHIPSGEEIEGTSRKWFGLSDLVDAYESSKAVRKERDEKRRTGMYLQPMQKFEPNIKQIKMP